MCPSGSSKPARRSAKDRGRVAPIHKGKTPKVFSRSTASSTHGGVEGTAAARAGSTPNARNTVLTIIQQAFNHNKLRIQTKISRLQP